MANTDEDDQLGAQFDAHQDTLTGDIAAWLIGRLQNYAVPYSKMNEGEQRVVIEEAHASATNLVRSIVNLVASNGRDTIPVMIKKVENNGELIKVTLTAPKHTEQRHILFDGANCPGHLIVADHEKYEGGDVPQPEPDQRTLPVDDDNEFMGDDD